MKFLLAANEKDPHSKISPVFARAYFFAIYDTETKIINFVTNEACQSQSGAGIKAAQLVVDLNIDTLIVVRLGEKSYDILKLANIKVLQTSDDYIENIFEKADEGKLPELQSGLKDFNFHA